MDQNPFSPPRANLETAPAPAPRSTGVYLLVALTAIKLALDARYFPVHLELIQNGTMTANGPLLAVVSELFLLLGMVRLAIWHKGSVAFVLAAAGFALATLIAWGMLLLPPLMLHSGYTLGAGLGFLGWRVARDQSDRTA